MQLQSGGGADGDIHICGRLAVWSFRPGAVSSHGPWRSCGEKVSEPLKYSWEVEGTSQKATQQSFPTPHGPVPFPHLPHLGDPPQFSHTHWGQCWDPRTQTLPPTWSRHSPLWTSQGLFSVPSNLILHPPRHPLECNVSSPVSPGPAYPCCLFLTLFSVLLQAAAGVTPNRLGNSHQDPSVDGEEPASPSVSPAK